MIWDKTIQSEIKTFQSNKLFRLGNSLCILQRNKTALPRKAGGYARTPITSRAITGLILIDIFTMSLGLSQGGGVIAHTWSNKCVLIVQITWKLQTDHRSYSTLKIHVVRWDIHGTKCESVIMTYLYYVEASSFR